MMHSTLTNDEIKFLTQYRQKREASRHVTRDLPADIVADMEKLITAKHIRKEAEKKIDALGIDERDCRDNIRDYFNNTKDFATENCLYYKGKKFVVFNEYFDGTCWLCDSDSDDDDL